jgi:NTP pyrophosphatase (non-canonical NTP hydrolase)
VIESQRTIVKWADETFGPPSSNARIAARANEEMAELLRKLTADDDHEGAAEEIADVVIVLYRLANRLGGHLDDLIDAKMRVNRLRQWNKTPDGHGYHVRERPANVDSNDIERR